MKISIQMNAFVLVLLMIVSFACRETVDDNTSSKTQVIAERTSMPEQTMDEEQGKEGMKLLVQKAPVHNREVVSSKVDEIDEPIASTKHPSTGSADVKDPQKMVEDTFDQGPSAENDLDQETNPVSEVLVHPTFNVHQHLLFHELLQKYVHGPTVDYAGFKSEEIKFDEYLEGLKNNPVTSDWSRDEKLAFWINVYNAFTIKLILQHYPVRSIQDISEGKPWDKNWIIIGQQTYSLNQIEHEIIRPIFKEPRIHFAVNCAAKSCPPLANQAYTPEGLNALLESQTKSFINNVSYNEINKDAINLSKIFEWYRADFGDLRSFIAKYSREDINSDAKISFMEYDWDLNN